MTPYLSLQAHTLSLSKCEPWQSRFFLLSYLNGLIRYPYVYFFPLLIWPSKITLRKQTFLLRKSLAVSDRPNFFYTFRFSMLLDKMSHRFCNIKATPTAKLMMTTSLSQLMVSWCGDTSRRLISLNYI